MTERKERRSTCLHLLRKLSSYRFAQRGGSPLEEDTLKTEAKGMGCPHPTDKSETHINRQNYLTWKNIFRLRAHTPYETLAKEATLCVRGYEGVWRTFINRVWVKPLFSRLPSLPYLRQGFTRDDPFWRTPDKIGLHKYVVPLHGAHINNEVFSEIRKHKNISTPSWSLPIRTVPRAIMGERANLRALAKGQSGRVHLSPIMALDSTYVRLHMVEFEQ